MILILRIFFFSLLVFLPELFGKEQTKIIVGTKVAEPFVIKGEDGAWSGISIDLWKKISENLNLEYEIIEYDLKGLTDAVTKEKIDIAVSPLTITAEREKQFNFTHSYFTTGLSIAVSKKENNGLINIFRKIFSIQFMEVILLIFLILFIVGFLVWFFERKKNKDQFGDGLSNGLGSSFWWAAVTLTTVGYGDKVPKTIGGRTIAIIWMFAGLVMISSFTAAIASALTVDSLEINIDNLNDLYDVRVGTIGSTSSAEYLIQNDFSFITVGSIGEGLRFIQENRIDAFVYDAPILKYSIKKMNLYNEIELLPFVLDPINYAFAIPSSSLHLESINQNLLKEIDEADWKSIVKSYIGSY